jgi:chromosome segregation ATPase
LKNNLQEFVCELGEAERAEMEILHQDIDRAKKVFQNTNVGRLELEGKKNLLESRLNDHLMRKKQDLERAIHEKSVCGLTTQTETNQQAIRVIEEHLRKLESLMNKNKDEIGVAENKIAELSNYVIEAKNEFDKLNTVIEKQKAILEKYNVVVSRLFLGLRFRIRR